MLENSKGIKYYTPKEIAEMLNISDRTVYGWINTKKLKAIHYRTREKLVSEIELENYITKYWGTIEN